MARKKGIVKQLTNYGEKHPYVTLALAGTFGYYLYDNVKSSGSVLSFFSRSNTSAQPMMSDEAFALMMDDIARVDGVHRITYGANFSNPRVTASMDQRSAQTIKANLDSALDSRARMSTEQIGKLVSLQDLVVKAYPSNVNGFRRLNGLGATTSTSTTSSSSHRMPGPGDGETSMYIDPTKSGMFGIGAARNPPAHLMYDKSRDLGNLGSHCNGLGAHCNARGNPHCHCGGGLGRTIRPDPVSDRYLNQQVVTKSISGFSPSARRRVGHAGIGMTTESYEPTLDTQFSNQEAMITGDLKKHQDILGFSGLMPLAGGDWYE